MSSVWSNPPIQDLQFPGHEISSQAGLGVPSLGQWYLDFAGLCPWEALGRHIEDGQLLGDGSGGAPVVARHQVAGDAHDVQGLK